MGNATSAACRRRIKIDFRINSGASGDVIKTWREIYLNVEAECHRLRDETLIRSRQCIARLSSPRRSSRRDHAHQSESQLLLVEPQEEGKSQLVRTVGDGGLIDDMRFSSAAQPSPRPAGKRSSHAGQPGRG